MISKPTAPWVALSLAVLGSAGCGGATQNVADSQNTAADGDKSKVVVDTPWSDPAADLPTPRDAAPPIVPKADAPLVIRNARILTAAGTNFEKGTVVVEGGKITYVGDGAAPEPDGANIIDAAGRTVTPGIIDTHSHLGVYPSPGVDAHSDGNEMTSPNTAGVRAEFAYWPQDPGISRALAGGVTTAQILPGSANLIGGLGFTVEMRPARSAPEVAFAGAPRTIKMACGENPKRVYGQKGGPMTRMGEYAAFRAAFQSAAEYAVARKNYERQRQQWEKKRAKAQKSGKGKGKGESAPTPPSVNVQLEHLAGVLSGDILVQIHCYKASEIREMVRIADEFGFGIRSFHHALEAYKVRDILVDHDISISTWADWWGFKMEAFDGIPYNAALFHEAGGRTIIHSDSDIGIQRLNQEAAKALRDGRAAGVDIDEDDALAWITINAAWALGIHDVTGSLETGKRGDLVLWNADPFSVYARPDKVWIRGALMHDRAKGYAPTDFELGNSAVDTAARKPTGPATPAAGNDKGVN